MRTAIAKFTNTTSNIIEIIQLAVIFSVSTIAGIALWLLIIGTPAYFIIKLLILLWRV